MREIKFRGKALDNGEWCFGYFDVDSKGYHWIHQGLWVKVSPETVGQYSGLKDSHGNMIYKGDIIRYKSDGNYYVQQCPSLSYFHFWQETEDNDTVEVIGNIHDTPELLK